MKRKIKVSLLLTAAVVFMIGACGCTMMNNDIPSATVVTEKKVLTDRQKNILAEEGLPQEYESLTQRQKLSIDDIEEMLAYVEAKYGIKAVYVGYNAESPVESGVLTAYPEDGKGMRDVFSVERNPEGELSDTYMNVAVRPALEKHVREQAEITLGEKSVKVYAKVLSTELEAVPNDESTLYGTLEADYWIFADGAKVTEDTFNEFGETFTAWLDELMV